MNKKYISIFGSYKPKEGDEEYNAAYKLSYELSKKGYTIKNGGGSGIMKASTNGAQDAGGNAIGVILGNLPYKIKKDNKSFIVCDSLFKRLEKLINGSSGFVLFSGGTGTFAELAITLELINKGLIKKNPVICYGNYWKPVIKNLLDNSYFIKEETKYIIDFASSVDEVLLKLNC